MGKHWKILGLSLLALVGVLAVNASAAQAKWLLLKNLQTVSSTDKYVSSDEDIYFLSENGNELVCTAFAGATKGSLSESDTKLSLSATVTFTGCEERQFETCSVHSIGQPNGTIVTSGTGTVGMESAEVVIVEAKNVSFSTIEFSGEECPLNESQEIISGDVDTIELNALQDLKSHEIHLRGKNLKFGDANSELHMIDESGPLPLILGVTEDAAGKTIAVHLCNLGGAACTLKG